ncbi:hypothetical protein [Lentzea sp. NPDC003310]|uniref:hypothetical protein n=1 Tax=Lentzea sp. NPDC003310 TaxID=3154447 RepID=UPI0033A58D85
MPAARPVLLGLVLDNGDTFVVQETAEALLRRGYAEGLSLVCAAFASADTDQSDHLHAALDATVGVFQRDRDEAPTVCGASWTTPRSRQRCTPAVPLSWPRSPACSHHFPCRNSYGRRFHI